MPDQLLNYINGEWEASAATETLLVINPASTEMLEYVPLSPADEVDRAATAFSAGNVGVNVGVAAPMSTFHLSGLGESFFGDLHAQAHHAVEFYTPDQGSGTLVAPIERQVLRMATDEATAFWKRPVFMGNVGVR